MPTSDLRLANTSDLPELMKIATNFHAESPYAHMEMDEGKVSELLTKLITDGVVILTLGNDFPVGAIAAITHENIFSRKTWALEMMWYVYPEYRNPRRVLRMLAAYEYWARMKGCEAASLACLDTKDLTKLYERQGYVKKEMSFFKEL